MTGDFSRLTFDRRKHYSTVRMQQGRVQLDADWNEQADIELHRDRRTTADVVGPTGGPLEGAGFAIAPSAGGFTISPGRYYVDGILCENDATSPVEFAAQPDRRDVDLTALATAGRYIVYLDVWERHLTWLDDAAIRESALGGPDTATRTKSVWQVRAVKVGSGTATCLDVPNEYATATAAGTGRLRARALPEAAGEGPCLVAADAAYSGLENQLYRVQIHRDGDAQPSGSKTVAAPRALDDPAGAYEVTYTGQAPSWAAAGDLVEIVAAGGSAKGGRLAVVLDHTANRLVLAGDLTEQGPSFVARPVAAVYSWSRDNGAVVLAAKVPTTAKRAEVPLESLGPDDVRGLSPGDWVELTDDGHELERRPGHLARIVDIAKDTRTVTLLPAPPLGAVDATRAPRLRRWDGVGAVKTKGNHPEGYIALENGVEIRFETGTYLAGDHWTIPARTATADARSGRIEWPEESPGSGVPAALERQGVVHHYARLAILDRPAGAGAALQLAPDGDCRDLFPAVTRLTNLVYLGGDGQEAMPDRPTLTQPSLPQPLRVGVFRGGTPVAGAKVQFRTDPAEEPQGRVATARDSTTLALTGPAAVVVATTGADGVAVCFWRPDPSAGPRLLSQTVTAELLDAKNQPVVGARIVFGAQHSVAAQVSYTPSGAPGCGDLANAETVQEAIDILCERSVGEGGCCEVIEAVGSLSKVIKERLEHSRLVCLHLRPGDHQAGGNIDAQAFGHEAIRIELSGCGPGVRLIGNLNVRGLDELTLRDLEIVVKEPLVMRGCARVVLDRCLLSSDLRGGPPVCTIEDAAEVRITHSTFEPYPEPTGYRLERLLDVFEPPASLAAPIVRKMAIELATNDGLREEIAAAIATSIPHALNLTRAERDAYLALEAVLEQDMTVEPRIRANHAALLALREAVVRGEGHPALAIIDGRADTLVADCDVRGTLILYGTETSVLDEAYLRPGSRRLDFSAVSSDLLIRGTRLARIAGSTRIVDVVGGGDRPVGLRLFRAIHLTDVAMVRGDNLLIARDVAITTAHFSDRFPRRLNTGTVKASRYAAAVIADPFTITGSRGDLDDTLFYMAGDAAEAANLRLPLAPAP